MMFKQLIGFNPINNRRMLFMASPTEITVSQLCKLIGTPECPVIIDVRIDEDFLDEPYLIPSAFRFRFDQIEQLAGQLAQSRVVIYCQKGLKISQGAAAILRQLGVKAETLEGGQFAWRDAQQIMVNVGKLTMEPQVQSSMWVTKHRPKIDRIACPWLIRRFIDPKAQFLFVAPSQVLNVADKFNAIPFDIEDVFWSHRGGKCTFDTMLDEFNIHTPALDRLALIVRGADTNCLDIAPQSAGLLAASLGLSRMYKDDLAQLEAGMGLYDAFYRWSRDATGEMHDWPVAKK
jgi:rhodanese-related sulfurtransferase